MTEPQIIEPEEFFVAALLVRESVFSNPEVARELSREIHLKDARTHWGTHDHNPPPTTHHPAESPTARESSDTKTWKIRRKSPSPSG